MLPIAHKNGNFSTKFHQIPCDVMKPAYNMKFSVLISFLENNFCHYRG